ncbi:S8 family serine peptidase [Carboxylicivirga mesophila]|uniref:S8 family serine peptidase n=1 Tax=Carboxylicivirga mesophila TaxID=1166478 RepID=A0ABS5K5B1_9BACT|nr:S8 family serine peptidase [Carboxylicivirga mesophila]MBS2210165.1 S8 family serine peptidase [Carboxylicivirga mesophila]
MMKLLQMKQVMLTGLCLILLLGSLAAQVPNASMHDGVVRVKFKRELSTTLKSLKSTKQAGVLSTGIEAFDAASQQVQASNMKRVFPYSAKHDAKHRRHGLDLWYEVRFDNTVNPLEAVAAYKASAEVEIAEPVYQKVHIKGEAVPYNGSSLKSTANAPFDDQFLAEQWHYENTGTLTPSIPEADINVYEAWKTQAGQPNVIVSVVDGGIDTEHADLKDNLWVNQAELNGTAGQDDDGNGYVDDIYGFNFADATGSITAHDHGTHVAGTVAAVNNNGIGVAGVAGGTGNGDGARLMSSQVFTSAGGAGGFASAIVYGADNGAVISQNSWGYKSAGVVEQTVLAAIDYFIAEAGMYEGSPMKGGIVIFAAGNDFVDAEMYPGYYDKTFCVAALGPDNTIAHYSNYGTWVDIAAPGGDQMVSQVAGVLSTAPNNSYAYMQGTSMACPHVSGIAALAVSEHGGPNFTADELRLYLESSTHDIDQYNPDFAGKLGVGYIDAAMVLKKNEGVTPDNVTDLALAGIAQDFATLTWSVPADSDDGYPSNFQLFYHTEQVTESNIAEAKLVSINNIDAAGTLKQFEVTGLEPLTTYYFAIRSMDRWANKSALSANVSGTTNAGPDINIPTAPISYELNQANSFTDNTGSFVIENHDEGLLKWEGVMRHKSHNLDFNALNINYPVANTLAGKSSYNVRKVPSRTNQSEVSALSAVELTGFKDEIRFADGNIYIIGEGDVTLTNSSAMKFFVDRKDGFNLTNVEMYVRHDPETGPMVMEIYEGETLDNAQLIMAQEVESYSPDPYDMNVQLMEQLYFSYGQTFWVVLHVPVGNTYCLGAQVELDPSYSDYSFMSFDMGNTWHPLSSLIDDFYTWSTVAVSNNKYLGEYITLTPASGSVEPNQSQEVNLNVDGTTLINGNYNANILVKSNDSDEKESRLGISLNVSEQQPDLRNLDVIDYGSVFNGTSKTLIIPVTNFGYGNFFGISTSVSDATFEVVTNDYSINARDYGYITVKYTPNGAGNNNAILSLTDQKGHTHDIRLFGVGVNPAKIEVTPAEQVLADMAIGETTTTTFSIANVGEYPLNYKIAAYDNQPLTRQDSLRHKFGYTYETNNNGNVAVPFEWEDITTTGVDVSDYFKDVHPNYTYKELELGFQFPFYDDKIERLYITRNGILTLDKNGPFGNCSPPNFDPRCSPKGAISILGWPFDINRRGSIHYKKYGDRVIVQYTDVFFEEAWSIYESGTFQIVLFNNGDIDFRFKDIENMSHWDTNEALIGIANPAYDDEFRISGADFQFGYDRYGVLTSNETIFKVKYPGTKLVEALSKTSGYIAPGESEVITVDINTSAVNEGQLYQHISILSNDPFAEATPFTVKVNVNAGGVAEPTIDRTNVNFGQVFTGAVAEQIVTLVNSGNKDVEITSATFAGAGFAIETTYPKVLKAKTSEYIKVSMVTDAVATLSDELTITCADGTVFNVACTGEVLDAPQIEVDVTEFYEVLDAGQKVVRPLTITNNGNSDLELLISGNDWVYEQETVAPLSLPEFAYSFATSDEWESGIVFDWDDIVKDGVRTPMSWYSEHQQLWREVELPFEIKLYNQPTNKLWISWQGLITTVEPRINPPYIGPDIFPNTTEPNSLIAPYFGIHNYDRNAEEALVSGVYHKLYEDRIVVQWNECFDKYGLGSNYSFQAIIYTSGVIKYQYKAGGMDTWYHLGIVGLENAAGDDGVLVAGYQTYLKDQLAVVLSPAEKRVVPANSAVTFDIALDAVALNENWYGGQLNIINNTPDQPKISIPVNLDVIGQAAIEAPATLEFGEVMAYETEDNYGQLNPVSYYKEFEVANPGTKSLLLYSIFFEDATELAGQVYSSRFPGAPMYWQDIQYARWVEITPGTSMKFRVALTPGGDVATINTNLVLDTDLPEGQVLIPVTASVSKAPAAIIEGADINILANTKAHTETGSLTLSNVNGQGPLEYRLSIDYNRTGEPAAVVYSRVTPMAQLQSVENSVPVVSAYAQSNEAFDTTLEYDTNAAADIFTGYGEGQAFMPGIVFSAPAEGFKLSHIKTWYAPGEVLTSDMTVYVLAGGTGFDDAKLLTEQTYTHSVEEAVEGGGFVTIELDEPQQFYPNEKFYIAIAYQLGIAYPQGTATVEEPVAGRFFFPTDEGWLDVTDIESLAGYAWMIKALEKEHVSASWVRITSPLTGIVEAGQSLNVEMDFNAAGVMDADNYAKLIVESNDPVSPMVDRSMYLRLNQGPSFTIDPDAVLSVEENASISFDVTASDYEGDACTFELTEANEMVTLAVAENTITVTYSPDYVSAGVNVISITGTDVHNNASILEIPVEVINVNRAPEMTTMLDDMQMVWENGVVDFDLDAYFTDPDGEAVSYEVYSADLSILDVFLSGNKLKLEPLMVSEQGIAVTVMATDIHNALTEHVFNVKVIHRTGFDDMDAAQWEIYPNPASSVINIKCSANVESVRIRIMNAAGTLVKEKEFNWGASQKHTVNIDDLSNGIYLLEIYHDSESSVYKLIKK